jgi:hypothetical protein
MATSERPPRDDDDDREPDSEPSEPIGAGGTREGTRRLVERILKEGVRKAVEKGVEQITDTPENVRNFINDMKLPRELASLLLHQADETKNGLYRAVAKELRDFLEQTNLSEQMVKALTTLSFEIKTEIRFIPNDQKIDEAKKARPDVKTSVKIRDSRNGTETERELRPIEKDRERDREPEKDRDKEKDKDPNG